ncbi:hypothetical protein EJB05_32540, partial [Eragrostis curvula]
MAPHLYNGVISEILYRLPSKEAYRLTAVCRRWRAILSEPAFLCRHLFPRPLLLLDDGPYAVILQPRRKVRYTHLTVVPTNPGDSVDLNLPLDPNYTDPPSVKAITRRLTEKPSKREPPAPSLLDVDVDDIFSNLFSTGVGKDDAAEEPAGQLPDGSAASEGDEADEDTAAGAEDATPPAVEVEDYVVFFERSVPRLDISIVAAHGRLLLCRSRIRYYVCDPAANRLVALPPASFPPTHDAARGFHYDLDAATGRLSFTIVLLVRIPERRVLVDTFSSTTGRWDTKVIGAQGVARCLGVASPGIHKFRTRVGRSLGAAGGRLRVCAFDIRDEESRNMLPHEGIVGTHGVWVMDDAATGAWRRVHEAVVDGITVWYFLRLWNHEVPVDFPGASGGSVILDKNKILLRYNLETGDKVELARLYWDDGTLGALYTRFQAFPFYRSG